MNHFEEVSPVRGRGWQMTPRQALQIITAACLLEENWNALREQDEPELPQGFRHIRSAIGALVTLGPKQTGD